MNWQITNLVIPMAELGMTITQINADIKLKNGFEKAIKMVTDAF